MVPSVRVTSITKSYGGHSLFAPFSMVARAGELVALVGPSGSGKTTILGILSGGLLPDAGSVQGGFTDQPAWIHQHSPLLAKRSALANVEIGALAKGFDRNTARRLAFSAMRTLAIEDLAERGAYTLSGGEKQRICVARAMAMKAQLILADEPTAALDSANKLLVIEAFVAAAGAGSAVVIATHDQDVSDICHAIHQVVPPLVSHE